MKRWRALIPIVDVGLAALPGVLFALVLGIGGAIYLWQQALWLPVAIGLAGVALMSWGVRALFHTRQKTPGTAHHDVTPPPEWHARDTEIFQTIRAQTKASNTEVLSRAALEDKAWQIITDVAKAYKSDTDIYDFTLPEALALIERIAGNYRATLLAHIPFSDRITVRQMRRFWLNRDYLQKGWRYGFGTWRVVRAGLNPLRALAQEAQGAAQGSLWDVAQKEVVIRAQQALFDEVTRGAIELYSGRLDYDLAQEARIMARDMAENAHAAAPEDAPLRIGVIGQAGVGKSALINTLIGQARANVDVVAGDDGLRGYPAVLAGQDVVLMDDAGYRAAADQERITDLARRVDLVVLVMALKRPARALDAQMARAIKDMFAKEPRRRPPDILVVTSAAGGAKAGDFARYQDQLAALFAEWGVIGAGFYPSDTDAESTQRAALIATLTGHFDSARMVQRSRYRAQKAGLSMNAHKYLSLFKFK